jgi:SAM-dependent methyltransferase
MIINACRSCGNVSLNPVISFGQMPLANALLTEEQLRSHEETYILDLVFCPHCSLAQITETVSPDRLFREYLYFSSFSDTLLHHVQKLVEKLILSRRLGDNSLVLEVGSNDGYLLQYYKRVGIPVLGIEPAVNVARVAQDERNIPTLCEFFGETLAKQLRKQGKRPDVIHAHNVLAHVADLNGFIEGIRILLKESGIAVIEVPYVNDMVERCEFDTIYHEHLCYFSLTSLDHLFRRHGLILTDVERITIHGGSLRLFVSNGDRFQPSNAVHKLLGEEKAKGVDQKEFYVRFGHRVEQTKTSLLSFLESFKRDGKRMAAYGAAAKGAVLLNYCGIGKNLIDFVVDRSPHKQGRYMPGVHLPIYPTEKLLDIMPDYVLILSWNFAEEIISQQTKYHRRNGHFIIPIPDVRVI